MRIFLLALVCMFGMATASAETQMEKDSDLLFKMFYKGVLMKVTNCTHAAYPDAEKYDACVAKATSQGYRFPSEEAGKAEARRCAQLHAGLLPYNGWKIINDPATDPWTEWRCLSCTDTNQENVAKRSVRTYVVDAAGNVYDHRMRYFIKPNWAKQLGKINPTFAVTMWNNQASAVNAALAAQAP